MDQGGNENVSALRSRAPGEDHSNPYEDVDISQLPDWWQKSIETFREHGLRPYRPPRFEDGELKYKVIEELEDKYNIEIDVVGINATYGDDWMIYIDNTAVCPIGRTRSTEGYTLYECSSEEFEKIIESEVNATD